MPHATLPRASWHLDAALEWAGLGFAILPLHKPVGIGCSCRRGPACSSPGKHPRTRHGVSDATTDADQLEAWWYRWPDANIGIATGRASGLVVIDVDPRSGGHDYLAQLQHEHGGLPTTVTVRTGGNGWHHYFAGPESEVPGRVLAPGVDLKGDGGYVVAPPSLHVSGAVYQLLTSLDEVPLAPLPQWITSHAPEPPARRRARSQPTNSPGTHVKAPNLLSGTIPEGYRNDTLMRLGGRLRALGAGFEEIEARLLQANEERCEPPLSDAEVSKVARSVARYPASLETAVDEALDALRHDQSFNGRAGGTDRQVLRYALSVARREGSLEVPVPVVDVANDVGVGKDTAARAQQRLWAAGYIEQVPIPLRPGDARIWTVTVLPSVTRTDNYVRHHKHRAPMHAGNEKQERHDALLLQAKAQAWGLWEWSVGLRKSTQHVFELVVQLGEASRADLAEATGLTRHGVDRHLRKLAAYGLVEQVGRGVWSVGSADPVDVAKVLGVDTRRDERREHYKREREGWQRYLEEVGRREQQLAG